MTSYSGAIFFWLLIVLSSISFGSAKVYTVGDTDGWTFSVDYDAWVSDKTFKVGDKLVFKYDTSHTVDLVTSGDYATCAADKSVASYNSGTTTITLNTTGPQYFICADIGHCVGGMKLAVHVTAGDGGAGSPSPAPSADSPTINDSPSAAPSADSPTTNGSPSATPSAGTTHPPVAGTSNDQSESSSPAISPPVAVVVSLIALMSELIIA